MTTTTTVARPQSSPRARLLDRSRLRAQFNRRVLTWLANGKFVFLYLPIFIQII
jgi:hypothetical protein